MKNSPDVCAVAACSSDSPVIVFDEVVFEDLEPSDELTPPPPASRKRKRRMPIANTPMRKDLYRQRKLDLLEEMARERKESGLLLAQFMEIKRAKLDKGD